ncbi:MAG: hypothetical protein AB7N65_03275 [Vicinamibacterales bacterium]
MAAWIAGSTLALWLLAGQPGTADLARAKALYAEASYEEALSVLAALKDSKDAARSEAVLELRALCLLALGRTDEAERAVAEIVLQNPMYRLEQADVSPKLVALFREVRQRTLPAAARKLYADAKGSYDDEAWSDATRGFAALLALLADPDAASHEETLADLKQLGEGFLALAEAEVASARRAEEEAQRTAQEAAAAAAAETARRAAEAAAAEQRAAEERGHRIYSAGDPDVIPPVELRRVMPRWIPPTPSMALMSLSGLLELVIDEEGTVMSATITKPIAPNYDQALKDSTRTWRYRPATRGGQPVRYRQVLEVVLRPSS